MVPTCAPALTYMATRSLLSCKPHPSPQLLVWMLSTSTLEQLEGERGRRVRQGGQGQTSYNLERSYWFNKRLKVQPCYSNRYQQPLCAFLSLLHTLVSLKRLPVRHRRSSVSIQFHDYILCALPINCL